MLTIDNLPEYITLGNVGEKRVGKLEVDVSAWLTEYQDGVFGVSYERPGYPTVYWIAENTATDYDNGIFTWIVGEHELSVEGVGSAVFRMISGSAEKRSKKIGIIINAGHTLPQIFGGSGT